MAKTAKTAFATVVKSVKYLVVFFMAAVINPFILTSCEDDNYDAKFERSQSQEFDPAAPVIPGLEFHFDYVNRNHGWYVNTEWDIREDITGFRDNGVSYNKVSHKDDRYAVEDKYRDVSLSYTQERTSKGSTSTKTKSMTSTRRVYADSVRWTAAIEDGNLCYLDAVDERIEAEVRDTMRALPYVHTVNATVKAINTLPGTTRYMTRAAYVSDSICREVVWDVEKEVVTNDYIGKMDNFHVELRDTFKVLLLTEDDIDHAYSKDKNRVVLDDVTERCSFTEVFVMKSGEEHNNPRNYVLNRELKGIPEYLKNVTSFNYTWRYDNALSIGNVNKGIRKENNWTVDSRTDGFGALITNDNEPITSVYTYYHEGCTYEDKWLKEEFPLITPAMKEKKTLVESITSDTDGYEQARLFNTISTEYLGWQQDCNETVKLQMPKAAPDVYIVNEGWEDWKCTETIYNDSIVWEPWYIIEYSDGNKVETKFHFMDVRDLIRLTDWLSIEENESETTGDVAANLTSSKEVTAENKDAKAVWTRETRELSNNVRLAGSTQTNKWRSVEANGMSVTFRGKTFPFPKHSVSTSHVDNVTGGAVVGEYKVYNYTDDLAYTFGDNTKHSVDPGTIRVPAVQIVSEGWDEASAKEVWSDNRVDWTLDWVVKFSNGNEDRTTFAWNDSRSYTVETNWSSIEKNNNYNTSNYVVTLSNSANQSKNVNGAEFKWVRETHKINTNVTLAGSTQENRWTAVDPFNCTVTYKNKTYDFGRKSVSLSHRDNLSNGVEQGSYMVYTYGDAMSYTIAGNTKTLTAPGTIKVKDEPTVTFKGFKNVSLTVNGNQITRHAEHLTKYSDGREDRKVFELNTQWSVRENSSWNSIEANSTQSTSSATLNVTSKNTTTKQVNGATFKYVSVNATAKSVARLAGSTQNNGWILVYEEGSSSIEYNGDKADFDQLSFNISNGATVTGGSETNGYKVYKYSDKLAASLNGQSQYATAPGTIRVKVEQPNEPTFFPEEWGTIVAAVQTVANNETHNSYVYTWSLRFKNGYVLPVVIRPGSQDPEWRFQYVEKTNVTTYNGGTWQASTRTWVNTTADDQPDHMTWSRESASRANKSYNNARKCGWDEDHLVDGHPSVTTTRYKLTISNGYLKAVDTYTMKDMGIWSSYVGD